MIPELIDLREEEEAPSPYPLKRAQHPATLKLPVFSSFPPLKDHIRTLPDAAPEIPPEEVPEEQIIHRDDDMDPSPLQLLEKQVDHLLMPPPSDTTPVAQKTSRPLGRGVQLHRMPERERLPQHYWKEDPTRKMECQGPKTESLQWPKCIQDQWTHIAPRSWPS